MLLSGDELRAVFKVCNPFDDSGRLKPENERRTVLAANANMPVEIFGRAMVMAAAAGGGSPIIIQMSHTALKTVGGAEDAVEPLPGVTRYEEPDALISGAVLASALIEEFTEHYGAPLVAMSLDHFKVPAFKQGNHFPRASRRLARARLEEAYDASVGVLIEENRPPKDVFEQYIDYLCSGEYISFKRDFLAVVSAVNPAWGMIDTERLPPLLNYAVTKEISDAVRNELGNRSMMLEAEYGATGQSGKAMPYKKLEGDELEHFAEEVANFVLYTGADGISYPIGMEHAAKKDEAHDPDIKRLEVVQSRILQKTGRYVPFAQHGGTGAAFLAKGLVGKNNVNTKFLVRAATSLAQWVTAHREGIEAGEKRSSGTDMYVETIRNVAEECVAKLKEAGTFGIAAECLVAISEEVSV